MISRLVRAGALTALAAYPGVAAALSLTVSPSEHRIEMDSGDNITRQLAVTNNGTGPITVTSYTWDWWYGDDGEHVFAPPGTYDRSGATWVSVFPEAAVVGAGETVELTVNVEMPADQVGGYYAVAFVEASVGTPWNTEGAAMRSAARIAVPLLIESSGTAAHAVRLVDADITPPSSNTPLVLKMQSLNIGNTHEYPEFMGAVLSVGDQKVMGRFSGLPKRMLPGQEELIEASWSGDLRPGVYEVIGSLVYGDGNSETVKKRFEVHAGRSDEIAFVP